MANRKVLINRHTTGNTAPNAAEMFHGEIAVAHKTGEETLWTKNNADVMVPFISCAQTISIIDSKIAEVNVVYDVTEGESEPHIEVATGQTGSSVTFTLTSKDIESEEEFKAYSANTKTRIDNNYSAITAVTEAVSDLINLTVTAISGDTIIVAEPVENGSGSNAYNLTHRTGEETEGFKKIKTDAYGHVIASSAVTADDLNGIINISELSASVVTNKNNIEALSGATVAEFSSAFTAINTLSADTEAAITAAIEGLDSSTAVTAGKYLTGIAIADGKISGITEADLPTLSVESAGTGNVVETISVNGHKITYTTTSVATSTDIQNLSAATQALSAGTIHDIEALSGDVIEYVNTVSGNIETVINELSAGTQADLSALSAGTIADNNKLSADVITYINTVSGNIETVINELSGTVQANETDIDNLSAATLDLSAVTLTGVSLNNTPLAVNNHIVSVPVTTSGSGIAGAAAADSGSMASAIAVKEYVEDTLSSAVEYKGATGATPSNPSKGDLYIASSDFVVEGSKSAETGDFIIYDGTKWDVIEKNLDGAITGTLTQDTVTLGDSTNSVKSLANGTSGQVLTIANGVPTWVDDPELSVVSAGTGNVLTDITVDDHEITFTKGITAASDADLKALSGAVEDFSGATDTKFIELSAYTKDVDDKVKALSAGTIQLSADTVAYVDAQIDEVYASGVSYTDDKVAAEIALLDSVGSASTTGHYLTSVTITDGKISAVGEVAVPAAVAITATTATPVDTASAVLTGVTASGTDNHALTFGMSNKVFSASTADEAVKVKSALTINVLDSAGTTASTVTFDGSSNQTIEIPGSHDTATTEDGHYAPSTTASSLDAAAGTVINTITLDSKKHVISAGTTDKINSASTAESADTASKVNNALSISGYASSESTALDTVVNYDGSEAKSLTFGTNTAAGKSMSMTSAGVVDVEIIDCGEY